MTDEQSGLKTESIFKLSWPLLVTQVSVTSIVFFDYFFLGYLSDLHAGVVAQIGTVVMLALLFAPVILSTGVAVSSQYMGAGLNDRVIPVHMLNLLFSLILGVSVAGIFFVLGDYIGAWMGLNAEQNDIASRYNGIIGWFFIVLAPGLAYTAICASRGETMIVMYIAIITSLTNISLDALFVMVFKWGLEGIVLASILASTLSLILYISAVHLKLKVRFNFNIPSATIREIIPPMRKVAIPSALEPFAYSVQQIFISVLIVALGIEAMAAHGYTHRIISFALIVIISINSGCQILIGHYMGAAKYDKLSKIYWKIIGFSAVFTCASSLIAWLFALSVFGIFTDNADIIRLGTILLLISVITEPAKSINIISGASLRTVGDGKFSATVTTIFVWGLIPVILLISENWQLNIVLIWSILAIDEVIRAGINIWRWKSGKWKTKGFVPTAAKETEQEQDEQQPAEENSKLPNPA